MLTTEELFEDYIKLFKLVVESAGNVTGNKSYLEVERILEKQEKNIKTTIEMDIQFSPFVASLIFYVILDVHGVEDISGSDNIEKLNSYVDDFWERYIKRPTWKFASKHGLPRVENLDTYIRIINKNYEKF